MSLLNNILKRQTTGRPENHPAQHQIVQIGQMLSNRYLISETLGRGAMGEVYLAEDTVLGGVSVAVKVISQTLPSQQLLDKFAREAQIAAFLGHHNVNIVRVLDFGIHNNEIPFYVMEYVYGTTLADEIARQPLSLDRCIRLMSQVCAGLQSAHQGVLHDKKLYSVIHRDLKPGNIFITTNPSFGEMAKILDFGIAEFFLPTHKSTEAEAMGTLAYAASEQLLGKKLEPSADIYSLGITIFESLTGQLPIQPENNTVPEWVAAHSKQPPLTLKQASPHLDFPVALEELIQDCLKKKPNKRPQTIQEVLDRLQTISQSMGADSPRKPQTHEDVLDELFNSAVPSSLNNPAPGLPVSHAPVPPRRASVEPSMTVVDIQAASPQPPSRPSSTQTPVVASRSVCWPPDKPLAEIVFAQNLRSPKKEQASLWAMLLDAGAQHRALPLHRIEFTVEFEPHPMLAWVTIIHDRQGNMRCFPCFIDLVNPQRQRLLQQIIQQRSYLFLLFDQKNPAQPAHIQPLKINPQQQQLLHKGVTLGRQRAASGQSANPAAIAATKQKLKIRYQSLKAKLPQALAQGK